MFDTPSEDAATQQKAFDIKGALSLFKNHNTRKSVLSKTIAHGYGEHFRGIEKLSNLPLCAAKSCAIELIGALSQLRNARHLFV